jgi:CheY-like chemotaxis protein
MRAVGKPVRKILVVDDDPDVLRLFSRMLHVLDRTLEITTVSSGERALGELLVSSPDLLLLDVLMQDMDGWQVLGSMRRDERIEDVPTFLVSAQDPADQPPVSQLLLATMNEGLSLSKLLRCSLELSTLLLQPGPGLFPTPV